MADKNVCPTTSSLLGEKQMAIERTSVVGVFTDQSSAQAAVNDLLRAGFTDDQIGVVGREASAISKTLEDDDLDDETDSYAAEGAAAGLATGAGVGALWGLGVAAGVLSPIGPAIAGGTLAAILSSAAAGAAAAGLAGTLIGMGIPRDEAEYYESEFHAGRFIVTVSAMGREDEARAILRTHGGYDSATRPASMGGTTRTTHAPGHTPPPTHLDRGDVEKPFGKTELEVPVAGDDVIDQRTRVTKLDDRNL